MEKKGHTQLELFSQGKAVAGLMPHARHSFLGFIWNYEKAILVIVGFIITAMVSFALGVERGKKIITLKSRPRPFMASGEEATQQASAPVARPAQVKPEPQIKPPPPAIREEELAAPAVLAKETAGSYTIQVASFKQEASAQEEMNSLKKKGLVASIVSKGKYLIVCVGNFVQKDEAKNLLSELKKRYQDCFIRRL
jgi:septal ring-binding cell division protein DamX